MNFLDQLTRYESTMFSPLMAGTFELSIQASRTHYCIPRETLTDAKEYSDFEVAVFEGKEWINPLYDARFESIKAEFENCWEHSESCGVGAYVPWQKVQMLYDFCFNVLPKAVEPNEQPSETVAVEEST